MSASQTAAAMTRSDQVVVFTLVVPTLAEASSSSERSIMTLWPGGPNPRASSPCGPCNRVLNRRAASTVLTPSVLTTAASVVCGFRSRLSAPRRSNSSSRRPSRLAATPPPTQSLTFSVGSVQRGTESGANRRRSRHSDGIRRTHPPRTRRMAALGVGCQLRSWAAEARVVPRWVPQRLCQRAVIAIDMTRTT